MKKLILFSFLLSGLSLAIEISCNQPQDFACMKMSVPFATELGCDNNNIKVPNCAQENCMGICTGGFEMGIVTNLYRYYRSNDPIEMEEERKENEATCIQAKHQKWSDLCY